MKIFESGKSDLLVSHLNPICCCATTLYVQKLHQPSRSSTPSLLDNTSSSSSNEFQRTPDEERRIAKAKQLKLDGMAHWSLSEYEVALKEFQRSLILNENLLGTYNEQTSQIYFWIGLTLFNIERYDEALVAFRRTFRIQLVIHNGNMNQSTTCNSIQQWINKILNAKHMNDVYITMYNKALLGSIQHQLNGVRHLAYNEPKDAIRELLSALALERSCKLTSTCSSSAPTAMRDHVNDTDEADIMALIGDSYMMQKKYGQASDQYFDALSIYQDKAESTHYSTLRTYHKYIHASTKMVSFHA